MKINSNFSKIAAAVSTVAAVGLLVASSVNAAVFHGRFNSAVNATASSSGTSAGLSASANAQTTNGAMHTKANSSANISAIQQKADQQITQRVKALTELQTRVNGIKNVSASDKSALLATIQTAISDMTQLQAKIDADTDLATLKTDVQSITKSYRIYALVMPQASVEAAADRVLDINSLMQTLSSKLQARITAMQSAGNDVTVSQSAYTDFQAKLTDAQTQAQAAVSEVASLTPDQGNQTMFAANNSALKDARAKVKAAMQDLTAARKDISTIIGRIQEREKNQVQQTPAPATTQPSGTSNQ